MTQHAMKKPPHKHPVSAIAASFRARRYCRDHNLLIIKRRTSPLGPYMVLNLTTGRLVDKRIPDLVELARKHGLIGRDERLV